MNEQVRRRAEMERESASRVYQSVLWWFGHMERMNEQHMASYIKHVWGEYKTVMWLDGWYDGDHG